MLTELLHTFRENPQIAVFLSLAIGYYIGKIRLFGFSLGSTASVLLAALVIGQLNVPIPGLLKSVSFALFIFTIGYKVGPQFFGSLKKDGIQYLILSLFFCIVGLITAYAVSKFFGFDKGTAAGVLGGALTQSSVIGTADGAISHLAISAAEKKTLDGNVAIAYAITYLFGTAGLIVYFKFLPRMMGIDLKEEAKKLEKEMSAEEESPPELFSWAKRLDLRTYQASNVEIKGKTVRELESLFLGKVEINKIKRNGTLIDPTPDTTVLLQDTLAVIGPSDALLTAEKTIGPEVEDKELHAVTGEILDICLINKDVVGKTLGDLSKICGRGIFLKRITRQGHEIPLTRSTVIHSCDILRVAGAQNEVEKAVGKLGYPERSTTTTDLVMVGFFCVLGTLLGLMAVKIGDVPITLGVGGGVMVAGLLGGYLRSLHPTFGQIPTPAQWIFTDLGLNLFIACVGLIAGPKAVTAFEQMGPSIFLAGVILSLVPHILSLLFGKFVLRMNIVLLIGALTGAGTITAALNAVKEEANSTLPVLGYTVPYAVGNVLLTVWGTLIVNLV